jgi:hypothetical protein
MAQANRQHITILPLSRLFADPMLPEAFRRAEDEGSAPPLTVCFSNPPDRPRARLRKP